MVKIMNPMRFTTRVTILTPPDMTYFYGFWGDNRAGSAVTLPLPKRKLFQV
jgi:hypothetical protein